MDFSAWLPIAGLCFLGAASPGPSLAVIIRYTVHGSRRHGVATGIAHSVGVGVYALLTVSGVATLIAIEPTLQKILAWMGGAYLAFLGYKALSSSGGVLKENNDNTPVEMREAVRDGLMISLLNPKLAIFFIALFSQFIHPGMTLITAMIMIFTALIIDGMWYCMVAYFLSRKGFLKSLKKRAGLIDWITGVVLLGLAIRVFTI